LFPGGRVETTLYAGAADAAILDATRRYRADLLIMATHTRPPLAGLLYGSVARALLAGSPVPILLMRSGSPDAGGAPGDSPSRVLVALDGSPFGEEALPPALAIAQALHAALTLVRVAPPPERLLSGTLGLLLAATEPDQDECVAEAERYLDGVRRQIASLAPFQIVQTEVRVGDPQRAIVDAERDRGATTVVMATHGRSGWGHVLLGSVAEGVLRAGTVPVLFVRPRALRTGTGDAEHVDPAALRRAR
jgi:nucleotide-binding universal stress UspA family protein